MVVRLSGSLVPRLSLMARCNSKTVLVFKKLMGHSTFLVSVIILLGGVVKKSWPISHFHY